MMFVHGVTVIVGSVWLHGCGSGGEFLEPEGESVEIDRHLSIGCLQSSSLIRFIVKTGEKFCRSDGVTRNNAYCPGAGCCDSSVGCECHTCESTGFTFTEGACTDDGPEPSWDWEVAKCPTPAPQPPSNPAPVPTREPVPPSLKSVQCVTPGPYPDPLQTSIGCLPASSLNGFVKNGDKQYCRSDGVTRNTPYCPGSGCCDNSGDCEGHTCESTGFTFTPGCCTPSPTPSEPTPKKTCDPELFCFNAITCVDGKKYPSGCGPDNCDQPIGNCEPDCDPGLFCVDAITCIDGKEYPSGCGPRNCDQPIGNCETSICDNLKNKRSNRWCSKRVAKKTGKKSGKKMCKKKSFWRKCSQSCCEAGFLRR